MYGWRGRIGLMVPTGDSVMEPEFQRLAPDGVSTHANRVYLKDVTPDSLAGMADHAAESARGLAAIRIGVLAFGCTSGSFIGGKGYDEKLEAKLGKPAMSSNQASLADCLRKLGVAEVRPGFGSVFDKAFAQMAARNSEPPAEPQHARR